MVFSSSCTLQYLFHALPAATEPYDHNTGENHVSSGWASGRWLNRHTVTHISVYVA